MKVLRIFLVLFCLQAFILLHAFAKFCPPSYGQIKNIQAPSSAKDSIPHAQSENPIQFSRNGNVAAVVYGDEPFNQIFLLKLSQETSVATWISNAPISQKEFFSTSMASANNLIATLSSDGQDYKISYWDMLTGERNKKLPTPLCPVGLRDSKTSKKPASSINGIRFFDNGNKIAGSCGDNWLVVWDVNTAHVLFASSVSSVDKNSFSFAENGPVFTYQVYNFPDLIPAPNPPVPITASNLKAFNYEALKKASGDENVKNLYSATLNATGDTVALTWNDGSGGITNSGLLHLLKRNTFHWVTSSSMNANPAFKLLNLASKNSISQYLWMAKGNPFTIEKLYHNLSDWYFFDSSREISSMQNAVLASPSGNSVFIGRQDGFIEVLSAEQLGSSQLVLSSGIDECSNNSGKRGSIAAMAFQPKQPRHLLLATPFKDLKLLVLPEDFIGK